MLAVVMRMAKQSEIVKGHQIKPWLMAGAVLLCATVASRAINSVAPDPGAVNQGAAAAPIAPAARFSPGVADIVKLVDAKVDAEVIRSYVKNSPTAYNPSATEIIALKDHGVAPEVLTAMLQRGAEVRAQSMQAAQAAQQASPEAAAPYAPDYDYGTQPVYPNYPYTYPVSSYVYPSYDYAYPGYSYGWSDYGYGWPYYWPSFYFGLGGYGYRYPYYYGGRGYYGRGYYRGRGYYGNGARPGQYTGSRGGFRSSASGGRAVTFTGSAGGFRSAGGFSGHSVSFASHGGGGFGGHGGGRGR